MAETPRNPTTRFSDRVDNYVKYRPSYPPEVIATLKSRCGLSPADVIADIGSGTGILTRLLLDNGNRVLAVEPNQEMRHAAEKWLGAEAGFESHGGSAEATGLADHSVDLIVAAQAFHWFDRARAKAEFRRILRPDRWVALVWNERQVDTSPFLVSYEALLKEYATDYHWVNHANIGDETLREFFNEGTFEKHGFAYSQHFDFEGLQGRALSSSYVPNSDQPGHAELLAKLRLLFDQHQSGGQVEFMYQTNVYLGKV